MDIIHATPMTFGFLTWPLRPPQLTMVLIVKATFDIQHDGPATMAESPRQCHGPVYFDDDTEGSLRLDSDFALLKRTGECLLAGTCHPPAPTGVSAVRFAVGDLEKKIGVFGDRYWKRGMLGRKPTEPEPFESMPLRWERAFGGPGVEANPLGRGAAPVEGEDGERRHPLPNLENPAHPIGGPGDRPTPWGAFPIPPTWRARLRHAGTYDAKWAEQRFPHLATDFDPAFYYAAPPDQRLAQGFWRGDEEITLQNLRPGAPEVKTALPAIRPRGFLDRAGHLEEVPLVLDTIAIDADAGQILCTWRGAVDVGDPRLSDVDHLFLMDQPITERRSVKSCRRLMRSHLRLEHLVSSGFEPKTPGEEEQQTLALQRLQKTFAGDPRMTALLQSASGVVDATIMERPFEEEAEDEPAAVEPPMVVEPLDAEGELAELKAQMLEAGIDLDAVPKDAPAPPADQALDIEAIEKAFADAGHEVPEEVRETLALVAEVEDLRNARPAEEEAPIEVGTREEFLLCYAEGQPLKGDFSKVELDGEDLRGLDASGALLAGARFERCVLDGAVFGRAVLTDASFEDADLRGADFTEADVTRTRFDRAKLNGAIFDDATAEDAVFVGADLSKASLVGVEASRANLEGAKLVHARADAAELSRANLTRVDAHGASFVDARLGGAVCVEANFEEADLTKLRAGFGARFDRSLMRGVKGEGARFFGASLAEVNLSRSTLDKADFTQAQLTGATLAGCSLVKSRFIGATLVHAELIKSDLMKANLLDANLEHADLRGSSFFAAEMFRARVAFAQLELADLTGTKLEGEQP